MAIVLCEGKPGAGMSLALAFPSMAKKLARAGAALAPLEYTDCGPRDDIPPLGALPAAGPLFCGWHGLSPNVGEIGMAKCDGCTHSGGILCATRF